MKNPNNISKLIDTDFKKKIELIKNLKIDYEITPKKHNKISVEDIEKSLYKTLNKKLNKKILRKFRITKQK